MIVAYAIGYVFMKKIDLPTQNAAREIQEYLFLTAPSEFEHKAKNSSLFTLQKEEIRTELYLVGEGPKYQTLSVNSEESNISNN